MSTGPEVTECDLFRITDRQRLGDQFPEHQREIGDHAHDDTDRQRFGGLLDEFNRARTAKTA